MDEESMPVVEPNFGAGGNYEHGIPKFVTYR